MVAVSCSARSLVGGQTRSAIGDRKRLPYSEDTQRCQTAVLLDAKAGHATSAPEKILEVSSAIAKGQVSRLALVPQESLSSVD